MTDLTRQLDRTTGRPPAPPTEGPKIPNKQLEAMKVFQKVQANRHMGISTNISGIARQLKHEAPRTKFPEELFVMYFLPLFADEVKETQEINMQTWAEKVAGGETMPVDIVDAKGDVLFTVPPIFDVSVLEQAKPGGISMTHVERHYSRLKEFDVKTSQSFLSKTLQSLHIKEKPTQEVYDNIKAWNEIFERYGRKDKILNLLDLSGDPNKGKAIFAKDSGGNATDLGDYELDTD